MKARFVIAKGNRPEATENYPFSWRIETPENEILCVSEDVFETEKEARESIRAVRKICKNYYTKIDVE